MKTGFDDRNAAKAQQENRQRYLAQRDGTDNDSKIKGSGYQPNPFKNTSQPEDM